MKVFIDPNFTEGKTDDGDDDDDNNHSSSANDDIEDEDGVDFGAVDWLTSCTSYQKNNNLVILSIHSYWISSKIVNINPLIITFHVNKFI